jgi:hypothetical protein
MSRQERPYYRCFCTQNRLIDVQHLTLIDNCPVCLEYGVRCFVGSHPTNDRANEQVCIYECCMWRLIVLSTVGQTLVFVFGSGATVIVILSCDFHNLVLYVRKSIP